MCSGITLVIGANGLIGSSFVSLLKQKRRDVVGVDACSGPNTDFVRSVSGYRDIEDIWTDIAKKYAYISLVYAAGKNGSVEHGGLTERYSMDAKDEAAYFHANVLIPQDISLGIVQACDEMYDKVNLIIWIVVSHYGHTAANDNLYPSGCFKPIGYITSKHAAIGLVKALASRFSSERISVNGFSPGGVLNGQNTEFQEKYRQYVPVGRLAIPDEIAIWMGAVMDPLNPVYATGSVVNVDGGALSW